MAAEFWHEFGEFHEKLPSEKLILYVHGQFLDAIQKEKSEDSRNQGTLNGTFIQRVPTDEAHPLLRGSRRIVLKPPHPADIPGFHCEVFAVRLDESSRSLPHEEYMKDVDFYVLRDYTNKRPGPYWLLNEDGASTAEVDDIAPLEPDDFVTASSLEYLEIAEEMFRKYSGYNIVALSE
jgi:hypothetical protein